MPRHRTRTEIGLSQEPGYYSAVTLCQDRIPTKSERGYAFSIAAIRNMGRLPLDPFVTIITGENGSGKSTLIEAIAVAAGFNAEGGSRGLNFATRRSESDLHAAINLERGARRELDGYFLRAESMYNVATELERLDVDIEHLSRKLINSYGGTSLHDQSHGESFFALIANRLSPDSFILMDEPESALSPQRQLYLLGQMRRLAVHQRCQIVLSTHSPILMSYPGALVYRLTKTGIQKVEVRDTEHFTLTRHYLENYQGYLKKLFDEIDARHSSTAK